MTDRELLELAAKAAGIEQGAERADCGISTTLSDGRHSYLPQWNPLTDDGDALRLAMVIGMDLIEIVFDEWPDHGTGIMRKKPNIPATRRAIVRAAASIGQGVE